MTWQLNQNKAIVVTQLPNTNRPIRATTKPLDPETENSIIHQDTSIARIQLLRDEKRIEPDKYRNSPI